MQQYDMNLSLQTIDTDVKAAKKSYIKGVFQGTKQKKKRGQSFSSSVTSSSSDAYSGLDIGTNSKPSTANGGKKTHGIKRDTKVSLSTKLEVLEELLQNSVKGDL